MKPAIRKAPQQERSKMLVATIKETCRQVIFGEIEAPLTTTALAHLSGVAVGSLYQYFPDIESVVASVYKDLADNLVSSQHEFAIRQLSQMPLDEGLRYIIATTLNFHRQMLELSPKFHSQYYDCLNLNECFNSLVEDEHDTVWIVSRLIEKEQSELGDIDIHFAASLMIEVILTSVNIALRDSPESLAEQKFEQRLLNMCLGLLKPS